jgi:hypothetical protein
MKFLSLITSLTVVNAICFKYHASDCREFKLESWPSIGIENQMTIGNSENMPAELADDFSGIWYMNGNPLADELVSFANVEKDPKTGGYLRRVYDEKIWTWSNNSEGIKLYKNVRTFGLTYLMTKVNSTHYNVKPILKLPTYLFNAQIPIGRQLVVFDVVRTSDPNIWLRVTDFFGERVGDYQFTRIVYGNGTRTEKYSDIYIPNIDSKKAGVTLSQSQLVPVVN